MLLFILTLWGTVAQVDQGLYDAQERFFYSWFFVTAGFIPFPGAKLVLWVMFINLVCVSITRFVYRWDHLGIITIHTGLLTYFVAAFITYSIAVESNVTFWEGEGTNVSQSYQHWELSIWREEVGNKKEVTALDLNTLKINEILIIDELDMIITPKTLYQNARAYINSTDKDPDLINQSGISSLTALKRDKEREKNIPGGIFEIQIGEDTSKVLLFGGEAQPNHLLHTGLKTNFQLRRKRFELPFIIQLNEFEMEVHPGTDTAKSYKSKVTIEHDDLKRDVLIWMNHPLRFKDYTLYQASYSLDRFGRESSTLAVVKNAGWMLPYGASSITFIGLAIHFLTMAFKSRVKRA